MNIGLVKKIFSTVLLVGTAVSAAVNVFTEDKKAKEFEEMKKAIDELKSNK